MSCQQPAWRLPLDTGLSVWLSQPSFAFSESLSWLTHSVLLPAGTWNFSVITGGPDSLKSFTNKWFWREPWLSQVDKIQEKSWTLVQPAELGNCPGFIGLFSPYLGETAVGQSGNCSWPSACRRLPESWGDGLCVAHTVPRGLTRVRICWTPPWCNMGLILSAHKFDSWGPA